MHDSRHRRSRPAFHIRCRPRNRARHGHNEARTEAAVAKVEDEVKAIADRPGRSIDEP